MEKEGEGAIAASPKEASPSKRNIKPRPKVCERPARADPPRKVVRESFAQPEEEEESKPTRVHRKRKLPDRAGPHAGVVLSLKFPLHWTWF